ncbi:MAG: ABC transporter permease [Anaerolineae bacterium]|nr:ABC transporter permease [Anaerolineae bacterium]
MKKLWLIFRHEYTRHVLRKRFLMALLSVPIFVVVMSVLVVIAVAVQNDRTPIGYVDHSGVLMRAQQRSDSDDSFGSSLQISSYPNENTAREALVTGDIQAYFVVALDYMRTGRVALVAEKQPGDNVVSDFEDFLRYNLASQYPAPLDERLYRQPLVEMRALETDRQTASNQLLNMIIPMAVGVLFIIAVNTSGGYLVQALVEEKENRTMEIVVTSVSPMQLMTGKIMGDIAVGLTQLVLWIGFPLLALTVLATVMPPVAGLTIDMGFVWLMLALLLPAFVLVAGLMAIAGATATDSREAQQIASMFTLPIFIPYWFSSAILANPNSTVAVGLSLFPLTAPTMLPLRAAITVIPAWQIALSLVLLVTSALGVLWLASRVFRIGMLRYGKRLRLKELFIRSKRGGAVA